VLLVAIALRFVGELGRWHTPLLLAVVMFYVSLIPADAPVVRSALMLLALAGTGATARRYDALGLLGWIACVILVANPRDAFSPGFQLSFLATAALISLAMPLLTRFCPPSDFDLKGLTDPKPRWLRVRLWLRRFAVGALVTCVLAWGISTPLVAHHSGWLSTVGVPASLLVLLPINLLLWAGFIALFAGGIGAAIGWDQPAAIAWLVTDRIGAVCLWLTRVLDSVPFNATTTPALGMAWSLCATAVLWWIAQRLAHRRAFEYSIPLVCIGLALWAAVILAVPPVANTSARITTIAIGPARAVLVQRGSDNLLVDPGVVGFAQASSAARSVYSACRELGAWHCPTVLVTKPTSDAMAAILPLIKPLGIELVLLSASVHAFAASAPASPAAQTLRAIKSTGVRIAVLEEDSTIELGAYGENATAVSTFVRLVAPPAGSKPGTQPEPALVTSGSAAPIAKLRNLSGTRATSASTTIELAQSGLP